jgi:hypothetical protein
VAEKRFVLLDDPIQQRIESIIKSSIPAYSYGSRREDLTKRIHASGYFSTPKSMEGGFVWKMPKSDVIVAWKSHATLKRQAGSDSRFDSIHSTDSQLFGLAAGSNRGALHNSDLFYTKK